MQMAAPNKALNPKNLIANSKKATKTLQACLVTYLTDRIPSANPPHADLYTLGQTLMTLLYLALLFGCLPEESAVQETPQAGDETVAAMRTNPLVYTHHGTCRMACRNIDEAEVADILHRSGTRDPARTRTDGECPSHALEGHTGDGQHVRIVYAGCPDKTLVVTAIDLDTEWPCDCE